jgi:molybdopterin synthase sulfur carrier subunit
VRALSFGRLCDLAGWRERVFDPALGAALLSKGVQAAIEKVIVRGDAPIRPGAEVAFLRPMSGG